MSHDQSEPDSFPQLRRKPKTPYGLSLTNNSKTGPAFSLPRTLTCIGKTDTCWEVCYGRSIRYQTPGAISKRQRNFATIEVLLKYGGPQSLATDLIHLIDKARPSDWNAAHCIGDSPVTPWTLRIHDVGDYPEFRTIHR